MTDMKIFIVEDDPFELDWSVASLGVALARTPHRIVTYSRADNFLNDICRSSDERAICILDLNFKNQKKNGFDVLRQLKQALPRLFVIVRTHHSDGRHLSKAIELAADMICTKGSDDKLLMATIGRLAEQRTQAHPPVSLPKHIYPDSAIRVWNQRVPDVLRSAVQNIHISGPAGVGKEVYVDVLKSHVPSDIPFIRINCAAIHASLMESEFFGHAKGGFTGANRERRGYFSLADGGWLFLDEVACLSHEMQASLLRVLESGEFYPVGSEKLLTSQVRLVSACNVSLDDLVLAGKFRADLRDRLCELRVTVVGLEDTVEEIPGLIRHFCQGLKGGPYVISETAIQTLQHLDWQNGQRRSLRNTLRVMTEKSVNRILTPAGIPAELLQSAKSVPEETDFEYAVLQLLVGKMEAYSRVHPKASLRSLAKYLKLSRSTLSRKLARARQRGVLPEALEFPSELKA